MVSIHTAQPVPLPDQAADATPGRICPLRYRYGPDAIACARTRDAHTLYVVGGLYGNVPALDTIEQMVRAETPAGVQPPTVCFNGDFNWFNVDDRSFEAINRRVLSHDAILGNVEAELDAPLNDAGCGCAYPAHVDSDVVERSNQIHARLKNTARHHAGLLGRIAGLPMVARYLVGDCRVGVVHGDAESLAGWRFDVSALDDPAQAAWHTSMARAAKVDVFASTHTCQPALRPILLATGKVACIVNNGAAGMPNFTGQLAGLCTRIATSPSPHPALYELQIAGAWVALLPVHFDTLRWQQQFLAQWPPGSAAWLSYFQRITEGPAFSPEQAFGREYSRLNPGMAGV